MIDQNLFDAVKNGLSLTQQMRAKCYDYSPIVLHSPWGVVFNSPKVFSKIKTYNLSCN